MAKKTLTSDLSISGIRKLQDDLRKYQDSLTYKARLLAERLSERGVEIARVQIADLDAIFTGELIQSLHSEYKESTKDGAVFMIVADSKHAVYVEMGTGLVGATHPYPGKLPVVYAQGKHFVTLEKPFGKFPVGTYGWFYYRDDQLFFTEGMPSRPFMWETSLQLMQEIVKTAKEVFSS